jgi:hypothetical protein
VKYLFPARDEIVSHDASVAAPPYGFGAHDGGALPASARDQVLESLMKSPVFDFPRSPPRLAICSYSM